MARAAGLPRQVVDFIPAHHGTSVIRHFYQIALQQQDTVDEEDYRYPGPKPSTREQAISSREPDFVGPTWRTVPISSTMPVNI